MGIVRYNPEARKDLNEINLHYLQTTDKEMATRVMARIFQDLRKLVDRPILDRSDSRLRQGQFWYYVKDSEYRVYYQRLNRNTIQVARVWPSKRDPLDPKSI